MTDKTAQARAKAAMTSLEARKQAIPVGEVKAILNDIAQSASQARPAVPSEEGCRAPAPVGNLRRGDVFIGKAMGGKVRPWVVLRINSLGVIALAMSSGDSAPGMVPGECRLWPGVWLGTTITAFTVDAARAEVTRPYTNIAHLRTVEADLLARFCSEPVHNVSSIAEVRERLAND